MSYSGLAGSFLPISSKVLEVGLTNHARCFLIQCPIAAVAILLIIWRLPRNINTSDADQKEESLRSKLARVDFVGFVLLPSALVTAFIALDFAGKFYPWAYIGPLFACGVLLMVAFCCVEKYWAKEPIVPMELVTRSEVFVPYLLIAMQTAAQFIVSAVTSVRNLYANRLSDHIHHPDLLPNCRRHDRHCSQQSNRHHRGWQHHGWSGFGVDHQSHGAIQAHHLRCNHSWSHMLYSCSH